jgi:protease-4
MGDVAASGGYWISMNADQIYAEPNTITGSIGIFGMFPTIIQPLEKLGIHTDGVGTTPLSGAFRIDRPLQPDVKNLLQTQIEKGYRDFIQGVAHGRDLPVDQVDQIARGRVWSGQAAKGLGLVDELGGLSEAIASAAELANLEEGSYQLDEIPPERDYLGQLFGRLLGGGSTGLQLGLLSQLIPGSRGLGDQAQSVAQLLQRFNDPRGLYAYCFCTPSPASR